MGSAGCFITGTDTGCGKTEITLGLMRLFQAGGESVLGMKPVASGSERMPQGGLQNRDARRILAHGSLPVEYDLVNPFAFQPPIAPHLAAQQAGVAISLDLIEACYRRLAGQADRVLVEGVGGWCVPLGGGRSVADLAVMLGLPVVMVVGLRLGCINHALLTARAIQSSGCRLTGWIANSVDSAMEETEGNLETLVQEIPAPLLGVVPYLSLPGAESVAACLYTGAAQIE